MGKRCRLPAPLLSLQLAQQSLRSNQVVVEDTARDVEQLADKGIPDEITDACAVFSTSDDVLCAQHGELLRLETLQLTNHRIHIK